MSEVSGGPDWWQASDGRWYPPAPPPFTSSSAAERLWGRFRAWPGWRQGLVWLFAFPLLLCLVSLTRPKDARRPWWALTAVAALVWGGVAVASSGDGDAQVASTGPVREEQVTTTIRERQTTTTEALPAAAPEGGFRSGDEDDVAGDDRRDLVHRSSSSNELLDTLASLPVEAEPARTGYDRDLFPQWDDEDGDGCDSRCEVLTAQRGDDGEWLSEWDGYRTDDPSELHVDHVVALAEAWDSGAAKWTSGRRDEFADHLPNLLAVSAASNLSKSDKDAAEWFPARAEANCLWASTVVQVKAEWGLSVDEAEAGALGNLLRTCSDYVAPTTTTTAPPPTTTTTVRPITLAPSPPPPTSGCTSGYSPCIPPGGDVDCAGGSGNGPRYVQGPVRVDPGGGDPYDLDRDGDGWGCDS